jgi:hypothetical protein
MGFKEGSEDELLLTCVVCQAPFGMTAMFCGECGSRREQALGVERARPSQKIVSYQVASEPKNIFTNNPAPVGSRPANIQASTFQPSSTYTKPPKKISRWSKFRLNNALRLERIVFLLNWHSKKVISLGVMILVLALYSTTQSLIFLNDDPLPQITSYVNAVSNRDLTYFTELNKGNNKLAIMPKTYNQWSDAANNSWINNYSWNGWLGSANSQITPGNSFEVLNLRLKAHSKFTFGIFRSSSWSTPLTLPTITISYPKDKSLPIFINGISAGSVAYPTIPAGTYYIFPGPFEIKFASGSAGTNFDRYIQVDTTGKYSTN